MTAMMKAAVFVEPGRIELADKPIPDVGPNDALMRITTTTICGTDVHILKGEYPVAKGLTVGHEPVGVIEKLGSAVQGYQEGQRVIAGAICPNFNSYAAQDGAPSQDGSYLVPSGPVRLPRLQGHGRLALRQPDRRHPGRIRAGARRPGQPGAHSRRPDRRAGADVPGHHVHRLQGRRERQHQASATPWWCSRRARSACAPPPARACWARPPSSRWTATTTAWASPRRWAPT
jgi:hypothetical protein